MTGIRCFIAVEVDDAAVMKRLIHTQKELLSSGAKLKLVSSENLHFTLHFLGNIDEGRIGELDELLHQVKGSPFELELVGTGCFRPQRPRVIWIGCTNGAEQMIQHQRFLGHRLREHGFPFEKRKYSPHLTIARVRSGVNRIELMDVVQKYADQNFGSFVVKSIKLKKSTLTPKGPIYEDLVVKTLSENDTED
ncbi:MAG: RNA 2',3'-cyclic phosphodiesterase [Candidatus Thorarchaeota archaeon]